MFLEMREVLRQIPPKSMGKMLSARYYLKLVAMIALLILLCTSLICR